MILPVYTFKLPVLNRYTVNNNTSCNDIYDLHYVTYVSNLFELQYKR